MYLLYKNTAFCGLSMLLLLLSFQAQAQTNCLIKMISMPVTNLDSLEDVVKQQKASSKGLLEKLAQLEYSRLYVGSKKFGIDFNKIKLLSDQFKNPYGTAIYHFLNGHKAIKERNLNQAFTFYRKALDCFTANSDTVGMVLTNNAIGLVNLTNFGRTTGNAQAVLDHAEESLRLAKLSKNDELVVIALGAFSHYYNLPQNHNLDKLENIEFQKLAILKNKPKLRRELIATYINISTVYFYRNQFEKAYKLLKPYYNEAQKISNEEHFGIYILSLATACTYTNRFKEAENLLSRGLALGNSKANNLTYKESIFESYRNLYLKKRDFEKALSFADKLLSIRDSVALLENTKHLNDIQTQYKTKQKEIENKTLKVQNERIVERNYFYLGLVILFGVGFMGIMFLWLKLRQSNNKLDLLLFNEKRLNLTKDKVFALISHDLRQPISELVALLTILNDKRIGIEQKEQTLSQISLVLNNSSFILDNLLQWSVSQLKHTKLNKQQIDVKILIDQVIKQTTPYADHKQINILTDVKHSIVEVNPNHLLIVFRNLINNAVKFTYQDGFISITTENTENEIVIVFRDSGIGISQDALQQIFQYPTSTQGTQGELGTGIGLTMSKELIEVNEGQLHIKSKVGVGTEVRVHLPTSASD
jgi:signal transduction histidine kinase